MARLLFLSAAFAAIVPLAGADAAKDAGPSRQADTYRPSATYAVMRGSTPAACEAACLGDDQCRAWSLTPPTFRAGPKCELKSAAGEALPRVAAVSGVVAEAPPPPDEPDPEPAPPAQPAAATPAPPQPREPVPATPPAKAPPPASRPAPTPVRPYTPSTAPASSDPDKPWPGLRRSGEDEARIVQPEGTKPLPLRRSQEVPSYSVQGIEALPGDIEDAAGLHGRLPSGHTEDDTDDTEAAED